MGSRIAHVGGSVNGWQYAEDSSDSNKVVTQDTSYLEFSLGLHSSGCLRSTVIQSLD